MFYFVLDVERNNMFIRLKRGVKKNIYIYMAALCVPILFTDLFLVY